MESCRYTAMAHGISIWSDRKTAIAHRLRPCIDASIGIPIDLNSHRICTDIFRAHDDLTHNGCNRSDPIGIRDTVIAK